MRVYARDERLIDMGASPYMLARGEYFYRPTNPTTFDTSAVDLNVLLAKVNETPRGQHVLMDIEAFPPEHDMPRAQRNIAAAAWAWKHIDPTVQLGIYRIVPDLIYEGPVKLFGLQLDRTCNADRVEGFMDAITAWQQRNDAMAAAIGEALDFICPCLYAIKDWPYWKVFSHTQLVEARRVSRGKPVLPIIWPIFRDLDPIPAKQWRTMCQWLATHCCADGVLVHMTPTGHDGIEQWREMLMEAATVNARPPS